MPLAKLCFAVASHAYIFTWVCKSLPHILVQSVICTKIRCDTFTLGSALQLLFCHSCVTVASIAALHCSWRFMEVERNMCTYEGLCYAVVHDTFCFFIVWDIVRNLTHISLCTRSVCQWWGSASQLSLMYISSHGCTNHFHTYLSKLWFAQK